MLKPLDYQPLVSPLREGGLDGLADSLASLLDEGLCAHRYGDLPRWQQALEALPACSVSEVNYGDTVGFIANQDCDEAVMRSALTGLMPWRKGPFQFGPVFVDTEWRSDFKWQRLQSEIEPLDGKTVLDVGCGSGYHCWRMREAGASLVVGIDPTPLFIVQFWAMQKYLQDPAVWVVPARLEDLPSRLEGFDTVFSMGVLYHRRSPFDHLQALYDALSPGGELLLETLVIDGPLGQVLVPEGRYSRMGNVWFIPSPATLIQWLKKMKFVDVTLIDINVTTVKEQRSTDWMVYHSLKNFLDPGDQTRTAEGYPAPTRASIRARKP